MIQIISLKIICTHSGMRLKMTGPSEWIQMERRFLDLIDLTNCWYWTWLRNCLFEDVQFLCHQYIYQMRPLHWRVIALHFHKTLQRCATSCRSVRRLYLCLYATLVTKIPVLSIQHHCVSTSRMYLKLFYDWENIMHTMQTQPSMSWI